MRTPQIIRWTSFVLFLLALPIASSIIFYQLTDFSLSKQLPLDVTGLLASASWVQALVAWLTLVVTLGAAHQIYLPQKQTHIQQELADREAYRRFISPELQSAKRFARSPPIEAHLKLLRTRLDQADSLTNYHELLEETRNAVDRVGHGMIYPLIGRAPTFDDLEALLNEYNYVAKLLEDGRLAISHATDLGARNFHIMHEALWPIIFLRRKLSPGYAIHFTSYASSQQPRPRSVAMNEQDKARFDALKDLARFVQPKWESRRKNEWRISFSLWTLLVAAVYYTPGKHVSAHAAALLLVIMVLLHAFGDLLFFAILTKGPAGIRCVTHYSLTPGKTQSPASSACRTTGLPRSSQ